MADLDNLHKYVCLTLEQGPVCLPYSTALAALVGSPGTFVVLASSEQAALDTYTFATEQMAHSKHIKE